MALEKQLHKTLTSLGVKPGEKLLAAVSGGADSVALLHLLHTLSRDFPFELAVAHFNHHLRHCAGQDAAFVQTLCIGLGVTFFVGEATDKPPPGHSVSQWAREQRFAFLENTMETFGGHWLVLAHHADDLVESALLRWVQGASPGGLAGLRPRRGHVLRPLLDHRKSQLVAWLEEKNLPWREDPSNEDRHYLRNRLRHEVLTPLFGALPGAFAPMWRSVQLLAEEQEAVEGLVAQALEGAMDDERGLDLAHLTAVLPPALARRGLVWWLHQQGCRVSREQAVKIMEVFENRRNGKGTGHHHIGFVPGLELVVEKGGWLRPGQTPSAPKNQKDKEKPV